MGLIAWLCPIPRDATAPARIEVMTFYHEEPGKPQRDDLSFDAVALN